MNKELEGTIKEYLQRYPTANASEVATIMIANDRSILSHRTLRRYVSKVMQYPCVGDPEVACNHVDCCQREESIVDQLRPAQLAFNLESHRRESEARFTGRGLRQQIDPTLIQPLDRIDYGRIRHEQLSDHLASYMRGQSFQAYFDPAYFPVFVDTTPPVPTHPQTGLWLVSGCWHFPFHNKNFFSAYCKLLRYLESTGELKGHCLIGDILDMHSMSHHGKGKVSVPGYDMTREYAEANECMDAMDLDGLVQRHYFYGNHEDWYFKYMSKVDAAKLGTGVIKSPTEALGLEDRGYEVQEDFNRAYHCVGDIELIHGEYVTQHAAFQHLQKMKRSVMFVHTHRMGSFHEGDLSAYNIGWGGNEEAPVFNYASGVAKEPWVNGCAVIRVDNDGKSHVSQLVWKNNQLVYGDHVFRS